MATYEAFVQSDVYAGQFNEDGERQEELVYYIVCEDSRGFRFRSNVSFTTEEFGHNHNGVAAAKAERVLGVVKVALAKGADPRRSAKWSPIQGAYGSAAWDERAELSLEARELEGEGDVEEANRFRREVGVE